MPAIFYDYEINAALTNKRMLSVFLDNLVLTHRKDIRKVQLRYVFCSDTYLHQMNMQYLNHDTFTDIITFDLSGKPGNLAGEIYISVERVKENAKKFNVYYEDELLRVIIHGALHLSGYNDKSKSDIEEMRRKEDECIAAYKKEVSR